MSFQSDHLLSFKPLWFNLSDLWFQPKFKFKSLRIFRAIFKSSIKPLIFSTGKLEYQHLSSLPDSQTELLVLPLKLGHHESKSTYQSGRWLSTRFSEPHLLTNIWTISNQIFDDHLNIRAPCYQQVSRDFFNLTPALPPCNYTVINHRLTKGHHIHIK